MNIRKPNREWRVNELTQSLVAAHSPTLAARVDAAPGAMGGGAVSQS